MRSSLRRGWSGQSVLTIQMESALRYRMFSNKRSQSNKKITLDLQLTPKGEPAVDPGEGLGGLGPPPYFYTSEARRAEKRFLRPPPPRPPYLGVWITAPPLSEGLDPPLRTIRMRLRVYLPPKQARATNCGRDGENKICPPKQWHLTPHPPLPSPGVYLSDPYLSWLSWREGKGV